MAQRVSTVLVTGANRGIGLGFVREYVKRGWHVMAASRTISPELADLKREHSSSLYLVTMDVSDPVSIERAFKLIQRETKTLDLVISNAGKMGDFNGHIQDEFDMNDALVTLQTNTLGPIVIAQQSIPLLKEGQQPKIIHLTSGLGSIGDNQSGSYYIYRISKAGLNMFNKTLSADLKYFGIICVSICPGWVQTDMGGTEAPLSVEASVQTMVDTIEKLTIKNTGSYIKRSGEPYPF